MEIQSVEKADVMWLGHFIDECDLRPDKMRNIWRLEQFHTDLPVWFILSISLYWGQFDILGEYFQVLIKTRSPKNKAKILKDSKSRGPHEFDVFYLITVLIYTVSTKKFQVCILAITTSNLHQIQKVRSVLKTTGSENFKTFEIWPSNSWDNWG